MKVAGFNHLSIGTKYLRKMARFFGTPLGVQISYNLDLLRNIFAAAEQPVEMLAVSLDPVRRHHN
jgi:hypothetical protein